MGMAKRNAFLAGLEAKANAKAATKTSAHVEIDTMALLLAAHEVLQVGPGRAPKLIDEFLTQKIKISTAILKEIDELKKEQSAQKEIVVLPRDLAARMKEILGPEGWEKYKTMFPFLRDYW